MQDDPTQKLRRPTAERRQATRRAILALGVALGAARMAGAADTRPTARASTPGGARPHAPARSVVSARGDSGVTIELTDVRDVAHSRIMATLRLADNGRGEFVVSRMPPTAWTTLNLSRDYWASPPDTSACDYPPEAWAELLRAADKAGLLDGRAEAEQRAAAERAAAAARTDSLKLLDPSDWYMGEAPDRQLGATIRLISPRDTTTVTLQVNRTQDPPALFDFYWRLVEFADYCDPGLKGAR